MVRMDDLRAAVVGMCRLLVPAGTTVIWDRGYPRRDLGNSIVTCKVNSGPSTNGASTYPSVEATDLLWTVNGAATGQRIGLKMLGRSWHYDVQAGDGDTAARDAFLALLTDLPGVTVDPSGVDSITFDSGGVAGLLWRPVALGSSVTVTTTASVPCTVQTATASFAVELQAYAAGRGVEGLELLGSIAGGLRLPSVVNLRNRYGVSRMSVAGDPQDISALRGPDWESRAVMRMLFGLRSYRALADEGSITTARVVTDDFTAEAVAP